MFLEKVYDFAASGGDLTALENQFPGLGDAITEGTLAAMDMTSDDGKARWTPERISSLYRDYSAEKSGSDDYAKAFAVLMSPEEFLSLTAFVGGETLEGKTKILYNDI